MIPAPDNLAYRRYQIEGIEFALEHPSCIIADEMGLGKSIQAIGLINADPTIEHALVVCPASLKVNWCRELLKWLVRPLTIGTAVGAKVWPDAQIVVINYAILRYHQDALRATEWDLVVMDEAQYLSSKKALRTRSLFGGHRKPRKPVEARRKVALTGTPMRSGPVQMWALLNYLDAGFGSYRDYTREYCDHKMVWVNTPRGRIKTEDVSGSSNEAEFQIKLREVMIRRLKSQVLTELPPKIREVIEVDIGAKKLIAEERRLVELAMPQNLDAMPYDQVLEILTAQQAIATTVAEIRKDIALRKVKFVCDHVEMLLTSEAKVVLFAYHVDVIDALAEHFGSRARTIQGKTPAGARQVAVDDFQNDPSVHVFIGQILAAGTGLTLTAARTVVFAELDWTPANMSQAEDRCHRIGQTDTVLVQHVVAQDSIDVDVAAKLITKQQTVEKCLDNLQDYAPIPEASSPTTTGADTMIEQFLATLQRIAAALEAIANQSGTSTASSEPAVEVTPEPETKAPAKKRRAAKKKVEAPAPEPDAEAPAPKKAEPAADYAATREVAGKLLNAIRPELGDGARDRVIEVVTSVYPKFSGTLKDVPEKQFPAIHAALTEALENA